MNLRGFVLMYRDGFAGLSRLGKTLWLIIAIKLAIIFLVIKLLFFPDFLGSRYDTDAEKADAVREYLTK
ncbi:MAG: DUF4492 domain-containing protein [Muribaculaceae bacterium]|nr:DUF4492 domain-containing protein [Muribaculaceae bacterium]